MQGGAAGRRPAPRRTGSSTTADLLAAALELIAESGVDAASLPGIAKKARVSTGPLYNRFDGTDDVVLALWPSTMLPALRAITGDLSSWLLSSDANPPSSLCSSLRQPDTSAEALVETIATIRRYPYAIDVVRDDATRVVADYLERTSSIAPVLSLYALSAVIGEILIARITPPEHRTPPEQLLHTARDLVRTTATPLATSIDTAALDMPVIAGHSPTADDFLNAALVVIARGGFDKASAHRIARQAGHSVSHSYSHFASKHDLAAAAIAGIIDQVVGPRVVAVLGVDDSQAQQRIAAASRALCDDSTRLVRRLRLECALAARHHGDLTTTIGEALRRADATVAEAIAASLTSDPSHMRALTGLWHLIRGFTFGALALDEASGVLSPDIDPRPLAAAFPALVAQYAGTADRSRA